MSRIFISYRRVDSAGFAGRLYDHLEDHFGPDQIFMDIGGIAPGDDFVEVLERELGRCSAVIVLIGPHWLSTADGQGRRRLDNPDDFVRLEAAAALRRAIPTIPVLVNGAAMPDAEALPPDLVSLTRRHAVELSNERFRFDVERLVAALAPAPAPQSDPPPLDAAPVRPAAPPASSAEVDPEESQYRRNLGIWLGAVVGVMVLAAVWLAIGLSRSLPQDAGEYEFYAGILADRWVVLGLLVLPVLRVLLTYRYPIGLMRGWALIIMTYLALYAYGLLALPLFGPDYASGHAIREFVYHFAIKAVTGLHLWDLDGLDFTVWATIFLVIYNVVFAAGMWVLTDWFVPWLLRQGKPRR